MLDDYLVKNDEMDETSSLSFQVYPDDPLNRLPFVVKKHYPIWVPSFITTYGH